MASSNQIESSTSKQNIDQNNNLFKSIQKQNTDRNLTDEQSIMPKGQINTMQQTALSSSGLNNMKEVLDTPKSEFEPTKKSEVKNSGGATMKNSRNMFRKSSLNKQRESFIKANNDVNISGNGLQRKSRDDARSIALSESFDYGKLSRNSQNEIKNETQNNQNQINLLESNVKSNGKNESFILQSKIASKEKLDVSDINTNTPKLDVQKNLFCSQEKLSVEEIKKKSTQEEDYVNVHEILEDIMDNQSEDSMLVLGNKEFLVESTIQGDVKIDKKSSENYPSNINEIKEIEYSREQSRPNNRYSSYSIDEKNLNNDQNSVSKWAIANSTLTPIEIPDIKEFQGDYKTSVVKVEKKEENQVDSPHKKDGFFMNLSVRKRGMSCNMYHSNDFTKNDKNSETKNKKMLEILKAEDVSQKYDDLKLTQIQKEEFIESFKLGKAKLNFGGIDPSTQSYLIWETETEKKNMEQKVQMLNQKLEMMKNGLQDENTKDFSKLENDIKLTPRKTDTSELINTPRGIIKNSNRKYSENISLENTMSKLSAQKSYTDLQTETRMSSHKTKINNILTAKSKQLRDKRILEDILIERNISNDIKKDFMRNPTIPEMKESGQSFYKPNKVTFTDTGSQKRKSSPNFRKRKPSKIDEEGSQCNQSDRENLDSYEKLMKSSHFPFKNVMKSIDNSCNIEAEKSEQKNDASLDSHELREELENSFVSDDKSGPYNNIVNHDVEYKDVQSTLVKSCEEILDEKTVANIEEMINKQRTVNFQDSFMIDSRMVDQKVNLTRNMSMMQPNANNHYEYLNSTLKGNRSPQRFGKGDFQNSVANSSIKQIASMKNKNTLRKMNTQGTHELKNNLSFDQNNSPYFKNHILKGMLKSQKLKNNSSAFRSKQFLENTLVNITNREENMLTSIQEFHDTRNRLTRESCFLNKEVGIDQNTLSLNALNITKTQIVNNNGSIMINPDTVEKSRENMYDHYTKNFTIVMDSKVEPQSPDILGSQNVIKNFNENQIGNLNVDKKVITQDLKFGKTNEIQENQNYLVKSSDNIKNNNEDYKKFKVQSSVNNFAKKTVDADNTSRDESPMNKVFKSDEILKDEIYQNLDFKDKKVDFHEFLSSLPKNQFSDSAKNSLNMNDYNILIDPNASIDKILYDKALQSKYFNDENNSSFNKLSLIFGQNQPNANHDEIKTNFDQILKDLNKDVTPKNYGNNQYSLKIVRSPKKVNSNNNSGHNSPATSRKRIPKKTSIDQNFNENSKSFEKELDNSYQKQIKDNKYNQTAPGDKSNYEEQKKIRLNETYPYNQSQKEHNKKSPSQSPEAYSHRDEISRIYCRQGIKSSKKNHVKKVQDRRIVSKNELYVSRSLKGENYDQFFVSNQNIEKLSTIKSLKPPIHAKNNKYNRISQERQNLNDTLNLKAVSKLKSQGSKNVKKNVSNINPNVTQDQADSSGFNDMQEDSIIEMQKLLDNRERIDSMQMNCFSNSNFQSNSPGSSKVNYNQTSNSPRGVYIFSDAKKRVEQIRNLKNLKSKILIADRMGANGNFDVIGLSINDQKNLDKRSISESYRNYIQESSECGKIISRRGKGQKIGLGNSSQSKTYSQTVECRNSSLQYNSSNIRTDNFKTPINKVIISNHQELYENAKSKLSTKFESLKLNIKNNIKDSNGNKMLKENVVIDKKKSTLAKTGSNAKREMVRKNNQTRDMNEIIVHNLNRKFVDERSDAVSPNVSKTNIGQNNQKQHPRGKTYGPVKNSILKNIKVNEYQTMTTKSIEKVNKSKLNMRSPKNFKLVTDNTIYDANYIENSQNVLEGYGNMDSSRSNRLTETNKNSSLEVRKTVNFRKNIADPKLEHRYILTPKRTRNHFIDMEQDTGQNIDLSNINKNKH